MNAEERAELVAYLDGELDEESIQKVETQLNVNPTLRAELETLKRTWELLDYLPKVDPSPSFTHQTMTKIQKSAKKTQKQPVAQRRSTVWLAVWAAALIVLSVGSYLVTASYLSQPGKEELIRELRIIENLRQYQTVDNLEFLQGLDKPSLFGQAEGER